jgi:hypothetical protein
LKERFSKRSLTLVLFFLPACYPASAQTPAADNKPTQVCDEYLSRFSKSGCQVDIDMKSVRGPVTPQYRVAAPVHSDVTVNSGAAVTTVLKRASPFLSCSIAATPGAPARDLSASITAALTTFGTFVIPVAPGLLDQAQKQAATKGPGTLAEVPKPKPGIPPTPEQLLAMIDEERTQLAGLLKAAAQTLSSESQEFQDALKADWRYSFAPDPAQDAADEKLTPAQQDEAAEDRARKARDDLDARLKKILAESPDFGAIQAVSKKMQDDFAKFYTTTPQDQLPPATPTVSTQVSGAAAFADVLQEAASDFKKKVKQYADYVDSLTDIKPLARISLPMDRYRQKTVTETITCKDAVSGTQPFDSIVYAAYYENTPIFDISAGALVSLLPGRQVGAVAGPLSATPAAPGAMAPTSGPCVPYNPAETCLVITSVTKPQFMPLIALELHPIQWRCPWANNGEQRHPFGYVCSLGLAGGLAVNPNNGTGLGEGFEGISFGISRVAFLAGVHNGHYQTFIDGYYPGEAVPSGTTPRTGRIWTNHLAFGIVYRIAQR